MERHLSECPDCAQLPDGAGRRAGSRRPRRTQKEVDYLKKVKRRGWRRVAAAVAVTVLLFAAGVAAKLFVIGEPANWDYWENLSWTVHTNVPGQLDLHFYSEWSDIAYSHWMVENKNGIVRVSARQILPSFLHDTSDHWEHISLDGVREVWVADQLIWQGGIEISPQIDRVYQAQTPYVGGRPRRGPGAQRLTVRHLRQLYAGAAHLLRTLPPDAEFSVPQTSGKMGDSEKGLYQDMAAVLAIIGNLDEIECAFQDENSQPWSRVLTVEELNQDLPRIIADYNERFSHGKPCPLYDDVKDYAGSCADLEQLYDAMWWAGEGGIYAEPNKSISAHGFRRGRSSLSHPQGRSNVRVEIDRGILRNTVLPDLKMKVRTGGPSCAAHGGDRRPRLYRITLVHIHLAARGVQCGESIAVVDHQVIPAFRVKAGLRHGAVRRRQHRGSPFGWNVDPIVDGFPLSAGIPSGSEGVAEADGIAALHRPLKPAALLFADGINAVNVRLLVPGQLGQDRPCPVFIPIQPQTAGGEGVGPAFCFCRPGKVASTVRCAPLKVSMLSHVSCFMSSLAVGSSSGGTQKP